MALCLIPLSSYSISATSDDVLSYNLSDIRNAVSAEIACTFINKFGGLSDLQNTDTYAGIYIDENDSLHIGVVGNNYLSTYMS